MVFFAFLASWREIGLKDNDLAEPQRTQRKSKTVKMVFLASLASWREIGLKINSDEVMK